jgi:hypothetical protein
VDAGGSGAVLDPPVGMEAGGGAGERWRRRVWRWHTCLHNRRVPPGSVAGHSWCDMISTDESVTLAEQRHEAMAGARGGATMLPRARDCFYPLE